jgi:uncharacterized repeat protein (TIGR01451 family)
MPTLNNDSPAIDVISPPTRSRGILTSILILLAAMTLAPAADAANTCVNVTVSGTTNWSDTTKWINCGGGYPGQTASGDTASILSLLGGTINVDVPLQPVIMLINLSTPVQVASGATLTLENSSTATSSNTFTVAGGGTIGTESGASITNFQGNIHVNGGTFNSLGAITFSGGALTFSGGSLTGSGTINISGSNSAFDGAIGAMGISGTTINLSGPLSYSTGANALTLSSGASINVQSGGTFNIQTDAAINGGSTEAINIASGGAMHKTSGSALNVISCNVNNAGTVDASTGGTGGFGFSGNGTHSGSFITGSSQPIAFGGNNTFNGGSSFSGGSPIKIAAGTQTFNAAISAGSGLKWEGGTIAGTGPLNVTSSLLFNGSLSAMTLTGYLKTTAGVTYAPSSVSNLLTINGSSGILEIASPGAFSIAGDYDILASPSGSGTLRVSGGVNLTKTAGTTGSSILALVDNQSSTVANNSSAPLNLAGGGQSTGTVSAGTASSNINFTGGAFADGGTFSGLGTVNVAGGTLNVNVATTFNGSPALGLSAGTLGGTGAITLTGPMTWAGGTLTGGSTFTVASPNGALTLTGAVGPMTLDGRLLSNANQLTFNSATNSLTLMNAATLSNGAAMTVSSVGGTIATDGTATTVTNTNTGTLAKTSTSGIFTIDPTFNTAGSVTLSGGVLDIVGAGTSSGSFTMAAGSETWFPTPFASTYNWLTGTTFSGGKVTVDGAGTVATIAAMTINNTTLAIRGGTFSTAANLTVTTPGAFAWQGGTLSGAGHTVISAGTTFDMTTESATRIASNHVIDNFGNAALVAMTEPPNLDSGSAFNNNSGATFDIQNDGSMLTNGSGSNSFSNAGTHKKSAGGSGFRFDVPYNQTAGTTDANSATSGSTIIFNAGGSMSGGTLKATQSTNFVDFFNGGFTITGGTLTGAGAIRLNGGILNVNAATSFPPLFTMTSGSLGGTQAITIPSAAQFNWSGGSITGSAAQPITVNSGGAINADATSSALIYDTRPLTISSGGNFNWNSGGNGITFQTGSSVTDAGTFTIAANGTLSNNTAGTFAVTGQFTYSGSGTLNVTLPLSVQTGGTVTSSGGGVIALLDTASVTHTGTFDAQSGSVISFGAGTHQFNAGAAFSASTGTYKISGGTVTLGTNVSAPNVILLTGTVSGTGNLTTTSTFAWSGGTMSGSGTTQINGTGSFTSGPLTLNRNLLIGGSTSMNAASGLQVQGTSAITNNSTLTLQSGDVSCSSCTTASFANNGTIQKSVGNLVYWSVPITGSGVLSVTAGTFFGQASANLGSVSINGSTGSFSGSPISIGSVAGTNGVFEASGGATTVSGTTIMSAGGQIRMTGGTLTLNGTSSADDLFMNAGTLNGNGNLTLTAGVAVDEWSGGTIGGSGTLTVNPGVIVDLDGLVSAMILDTRPLVNNGTINYSASTNGLTLANGAVITNASGATLNLDGTSVIGITGTGNVISNAGTLQRSTAGTLGIAPPATNTGNINANNGVLAFNGGLTQSAGATTLLGGSISSPATIALAGGSLTGNGTVSAAVNNSGGIIAPGTPAASGNITITGAYNQGSGGSMNLKIGGTANYDTVDASATGVTLAGALNVSLFNAFNPAGGNTFNVLKFNSRSGDFGTYNLPAFGSGGSFLHGYVAGTPNLLQLTAVITQSDLGITQNVPTAVLHNQSGIWTFTVTNGPTPVTNVAITDTFTNAGFLSVTGPCTPAGSTVSCAIGSMAANQSVSITMILFANNLGTITNSASVAATEFDPNLANNNAGPASTPVLPSADLSITNTASSNPVIAGSALSYTLTVANAGPDATSGLMTIANTFPAGVTAFTFSGAGWSCGSIVSGFASCSTTAGLAPSSSAPPLILSMTAPSSAFATDSATVTPLTADPNATNNTAAQTVTVTQQANLSITKSGPGTVNAGQSIIYTVTITNAGPSSAAGVSVADLTPTGLTFVSNSGGCTTPYPCAIGTMTNGQSVTITSTYATSSGAAGTTVTNSATVSAVTVDPVPTGNTATVTTTINGSADLAITKSSPAASPGFPFTYTITVTNNGPSDAAAVVVNDPTPAGTTFVSNAGSCTTPFPCSLGTITAGQTKTISSTFTTPANFTGSSIVNSATVSSTTSDPSAGNNTATAVTVFSGPGTDLALVKTGPATAITGSTVTYTLTIMNNGPSTATGVTVSDPTPAGLSFVSSGGACGGAFPCNLGNLTSGQGATITATYTVTAVSGSVTNTATVSAATFDSSNGNNLSSATTQISASACGQAPPTLIAPANGSVISSPVTFSWTAVPGASG